MCRIQTGRLSVWTQITDTCGGDTRTRHFLLRISLVNVKSQTALHKILTYHLTTFGSLNVATCDTGSSGGKAVITSHHRRPRHQPGPACSPAPSGSGLAALGSEGRGYHQRRCRRPRCLHSQHIWLQEIGLEPRHLKLLRTLADLPNVHVVPASTRDIRSYFRSLPNTARLGTPKYMESRLQAKIPAFSIGSTPPAFKQ